jgi:hypothetical protein
MGGYSGYPVTPSAFISKNYPYEHKKFSTFPVGCQPYTPFLQGAEG